MLDQLLDVVCTPLFIRLPGVRMFRPSILVASRTASSPSSSSRAPARLGSSTYREESQWRRINCGWVLGAPPHGRDVGRSSLFAWTCFPYQHAWRVQVWVHRVQECNDRCLRVRRSSQRSLRNIDGSWSRRGESVALLSFFRVEFSIFTSRKVSNLGGRDGWIFTDFEGGEIKEYFRRKVLRKKDDWWRDRFSWEIRSRIEFGIFCFICFIRTSSFGKNWIEV